MERESESSGERDSQNSSDHKKREGRGGEINYYFFVLFFHIMSKKPRPNKNMFSASAVRLIRISYYMYTISNCVVLKNFSSFSLNKNSEDHQVSTRHLFIFFLFSKRSRPVGFFLSTTKSNRISQIRWSFLFLGNYRRENSKVVCWEGLDKKKLVTSPCINSIKIPKKKLVIINRKTFHKTKTKKKFK